MASSARPQHHLDLGHLPPLFPTQNRSASSTAASSPIELPANTVVRFSQESVGSVGIPNTTVTSRFGAGSPSHEHGPSRFYPRSRTREIKSSEGPGHHGWGPPTASGLSTPLRETIPESPGDDGTDTFTNIGIPMPEDPLQSPDTRRSRAGTVPSRFPPGRTVPGSTSQLPPASKSSRPTPTSSPFRPGTSSVPEGDSPKYSAGNAPSSALLSRLRAGSMPQRSSFLSPPSPFVSSVFSSIWSSGRDRASTLTSIHSDEHESSTQSGFIKGDLADTDVKTLDYLGLVDTPQQTRLSDNLGLNMYMANGQRISAVQPLLANIAGLNKNANRFRSYSVNAKEKYAAEEDDDLEHGLYYSGTLTPSAEAAAIALAATQAQIHQHNLDVQAFANQASSSRPRARTAGVLDSPSSRLWRTYLPSPSRLDSNLNASDLRLDESNEYEGLNDAVKSLHLQNMSLRPSDGPTAEESSRALWLGSIPASTTTSSLKVIFEPFGKIESARVLTHKSCGFVNFDTVESAVQAKSQLHGKEIFPGAGPIRIGYAKAPSGSGTPGANGIVSSPSPDPYAQNRATHIAGLDAANHDQEVCTDGSAPLSTLSLRDMRLDIEQIVEDLGASDDERGRISASLELAIRYDTYEAEIPPVPEPGHSRIHDAPRLREIRKRIDNNTCTPMEIEEIALSMLPEIAELASDYLGNTVVQKLFEYCSENVKEAMLQQIAPHMAEIGIHKNGTWAAQKIIDVARSPIQMGIIVDRLRPYGVALFLDQYGNYVMQCCLRFSVPWNNFIFDIMLSRLWEVAQGRFGARAMRACLESHYATKDQQRMLAAAIALHSVQLATNANGALLLTWYLDTCTFPGRRNAIAPRLVPHLVHLCTHKVAYLTVLKIINQKNEPDARDTMLQALFFSAEDRVLEEILRDQSCGATLIFKILTTPFFDETIRSKVDQNIRKVLLHIKAQPNQGYKRLMDETGMSTRGPGANGRDSIRNGHEGIDPTNRDLKQAVPQESGIISNGATFQQTSGNYILPQSPQSQQPFKQNIQLHQQRNGSMDGRNYSQYHSLGANGINPHMFPPNSNMSSTSPMIPQHHLHFQQNLGARPQSLYNFPSPAMNGFAVPPGQSPIDVYRNSMARSSISSPQSLMMGANPVMAQTGFGAQTGYNSMMNGMGAGSPAMWQQYPGAYMMPLIHAQGMMNGGRGGARRGRVW